MACPFIWRWGWRKTRNHPERGHPFRLCAHGERGFLALGGTPRVFLCRESLARRALTVPGQGLRPWQRLCAGSRLFGDRADDRALSSARPKLNRSDRGAVLDVESHRLVLFLKFGMTLQQPHAAVPAKAGVVVSRGGNPLRFGEATYAFLEHRRKPS